MKKIALGILAFITFCYIGCLSVIAWYYDSGEVVNVYMGAFFDNNNLIENETPIHAGYGTKVSFSENMDSFVSASGFSGYQFVFWIVNGTVREDLPENTTFMVTEEMTLLAVFKPIGSNVVCFMDSNGQWIQVSYSTLLDPFTSADVPSTASYSKPGYAVSENPWGTDVNFDSITADTVVFLHYSKNNPGTYTVSVTNGTGAGTYDLDTVVTVTANAPAEGSFFGWWEDAEGNFLSAESAYSFTVADDISLTAMYDTSTNDDSPYVVIEQGVTLRSGKTTFVSRYHLPEGYELVECGLYPSGPEIAEGTKYVSHYQNPLTDEYVISVDTEWELFVQAYCIFVDSEGYTNEVTSDSVSVIPVEPLISEYGEGSSYNKWIEIYNPGSNWIDLSKYMVCLFTDGAGTPSQTVTLSGSLAPGDVYVISHATASIASIADLTNSSVMNFNGNDAVSIRKISTGQDVDVIGVIGVNPGTSWTVGTGDTVDNTLIRKTGIFYSSGWNVSEWSVYDKDTVSNVGFHENRDASSIGWEGSQSIMADDTAQLTVTYQPLDAIRETVTWSISENTPSDESGDPVLSISSSGLVTGLKEGHAFVTCTGDVTGMYTGKIIYVTASVYYSVSFDSNGGSPVDTQSILSGHTATEPTDPTLEGYTFDGWYLDDDTFANAYDFGSAVTSTTELHAKWTENASVVYATDLFISEYIEGSSNNKAIEIYNGTSSAISLSAYKVILYTNGSSTAYSTQTFTTQILQPGQTLVLYNSSATADFKNKGNINISSGVCAFNGDDAIVLTKNDVAIDCFGQVGFDPGTAWSANGVTTVDKTLVRKPGILSGDPVGSDAFDPSVQWIQYATDTVTYLGTHSLS